MKSLGIIAGGGEYPLLLASEARQQGVSRIVVAAFEGETKPEIQGLVNEVEWMRVGQLGRLVSFFEKQKVNEVMMAGQIAPSNLFQLRPDLKALVLLAKLKERNAESIFGAIADELQKKKITLLPATTYLDEYLAVEGHFAGPQLRRVEESDVEFGFRIAKEMSRLDIGQTVVVKKGTVLAV
ncbi:MAG: UDP-2,3-diacylglucosamine diphosphatase LpxI, partial [Verrucomicrobiota bacterium]